MSGRKTILVADDDQAVRFVLEHALQHAGFRVESFPDGRQLLARVADGVGDLVITDIVMPGGSGLDLLKTLKGSHPALPVMVITAQSTLLNAVHAFERGAYEYLAKPFDIQQVVAIARRALEHPAANGHKPSVDVDRFGGIIGSSPAMQELFRTIGRLANSDMTVLIHGESGTGKELVARAVHSYSARREGPFTPINMAAIPQELIESELFGHEKGAFTGAVSRRGGHFEQARGGTLFLDEIGDMPMAAQTRLLRVLQEGTFTRVGGTELIRSDVRIIAATHQDLPAAIAAGRFREDLFYRLNVIPLHVPSLRSRRDDIPLLADYFLATAAQELKTPPKRLSPGALTRLMDYHWPGNVRELENLIRRLMVLVPEDQILPEALNLPVAGGEAPGTAPSRAAPRPPAPPEEARQLPAGALELAVVAEVDAYFHDLRGHEGAGDLYQIIIQRVDRALVTRVLRETRGNQVKSAAILGINRNTLRKKIKELEIEPKK